MAQQALNRASPFQTDAQTLQASPRCWRNVSSMSAPNSVAYSSLTILRMRV